MLKPQPPVPQNVTLFGNRVVVDVISKDKVVLGQSEPLIQITDVLIKRGNLDTEKMPCEDENKIQGNASTSQRTPKTASKPPEARRET